MRGLLWIPAFLLFSLLFSHRASGDAGGPESKNSTPGTKDAGAGKAARPAAALPALVPAAPEEVRAVWITRWDYRTESDVRKIVAVSAALGLNRVMFQVRGQADAYYRSTLEPWGEELDGPPERDGDPGFDPLAAALDEARARGLSLHAWVNVLPGWKGAAPPRSPRHLVHTHPEWFLMNREGKRRILDRESYTILNPCLPAVRAHLAAVMSEIAGRYPVDGVQIDYIRFLERNTARGELVPYDPATLRLFLKESGARPEDAPEAWDAFRRRAVDRLVLEIARAVREKRPGCRLSVAAIRESAHARQRLFQDAEGWKRRGWIDDVYPMNYDPDLRRFSECSLRWTESCGGSSVVVGIGVHLLDGAASVRKQIRTLRTLPPEARPAGYCLFALSEFYPTRAPGVLRDASSVMRRSQLRAALKALNREGDLAETGPGPPPRAAGSRVPR